MKTLLQVGEPKLGKQEHDSVQKLRKRLGKEVLRTVVTDTTSKSIKTKVCFPDMFAVSVAVYVVRDVSA